MRKAPEYASALQHPAVRAFFNSRTMALSTRREYAIAARFLFQAIDRVFNLEPAAVDFKHFWIVEDEHHNVLFRTSIEPRDVQQLAEWYWKHEDNPDHFTRTVCMWRQFFRFLYREGITREDCSLLLRTPRGVKKVAGGRVLSAEQCDALLCAAAQSGHMSIPYFALLHVALTTGWRPGALVDFCWEDIDWDGRLLRAGGRKRGREIAPMVVGVEDSLRRHESWYRMHVGEPESQDRVFSVPGLPFRSTKDLTKLLRRLARRAQIPEDLTGYWLRRTTATAMYRSNIPVPIISQLYGHRKTTTTYVYIHETVEADRMIKNSIEPFRRLTRLLL